MQRLSCRNLLGTSKGNQGGHCKRKGGKVWLEMRSERGRSGDYRASGVRSCREFANHSKDLDFTLNERKATRAVVHQWSCWSYLCIVTILIKTEILKYLLLHLKMQ